MISPSAISLKGKKCGSPVRVYSPRPKHHNEHNTQ